MEVRMIVKDFLRLKSLITVNAVPYTRVTYFGAPATLWSGASLGRADQTLWTCRIDVVRATYRCFYIKNYVATPARAFASSV